MERRGLLACMEEWAGRRTSLFLLHTRGLTPTGTFCPAQNPHQRRFHFIISSGEIFIQTRNHEITARPGDNMAMCWLNPRVFTCVCVSHSPCLDKTCHDAGWYLI